MKYRWDRYEWEGLLPLNWAGSPLYIQTPGIILRNRISTKYRLAKYKFPASLFSPNFESVSITQTRGEIGGFIEGCLFIGSIMIRVSARYNWTNSYDVAVSSIRYYWLINNELRHSRMLSPESNQSFIEGHASPMAESFVFRQAPDCSEK